MSLHPIQASFAGGELSPSLWGRVDLNKYAVGLRRLENFIVHPHGGVSRRPGTRFVAEARGVCRLVAFQYSVADGYMLEFSDRHIRFYKNGTPIMSGALPYEIVTPYTAAQLDGLSFAQSADVLYIVHKDHVPRELTRYADVNWQLTELFYRGGPFTPKTESQAQLTIGTSALEGTTTLTASSGLFTSRMIGSLIELTHHVDENMQKETRSTAGTTTTEDVTHTVKMCRKCTGCHEGENSGVTHYSYKCFLSVTSEQRASVAVGDALTYDGKEWTVKGFTYLSDTMIASADSVGYFSGSGAIAGRYAAEIAPQSTAYLTYSASDVSITVHHVSYTPGGVNWGKSVTCYKTWRVSTSGFWHGSFRLQRFDKDEGRWVTMRTFTSPNSKNNAKNYEASGGFDTPTKLRIVSSDFTTFVPPDNEEQDRGYVILTAGEADHSGYARIKSVQSSTRATADIERAFAAGSATVLWREGAWSPKNGYPQVVGFYQERLVFGSTPKEPQTLWLSKTGDYADFSVSSPVVDDDAVTATLAARRVGRIVAMIPLGSMILLTASSEWKLSAGSQKDAITPTSIAADVQGYRGCADIEPVIIGNEVLYIQAQGARLRDLGYSFESDSYTGKDLSVMASHLINGHRIVSMAYQQEPDSVCWLARDDGLLLSLTYLREHDVYAWARHPTDGAVERVCVVSDASGDTVYLSVLRHGRRCIETMTPIPANDAAEAFFVDSGATVRGSNISAVTGLERLNGRTVAIVADGSLRNPQIVENGEVTVSPAASVVHVGLPFASKLETLDLNFARGDGAQLTRRVRVANATIRVESTRHLFAGTDEDHLREYVDRTNEPYDSPTRLSTGDWCISLDSRYDSGRLVIVAPGAMPASILAVVPGADPGD